MHNGIVCRCILYEEFIIAEGINAAHYFIVPHSLYGFRLVQLALQASSRETFEGEVLK